jgi:prephenate dehydrogenase
MLFDTLTIVGVGLIGGSIGLAAKRKKLARRVLGVGRNAETLEVAQMLKAIDSYSLHLDRAAQESDLILFCTPVNKIVEQALIAGHNARPGTILTDAGSTKELIVHQLEGKLPSGVHFVGSHPLAGSEKKGPQYAKVDLFEGKRTIVTPTDNSPAEVVEKVSQFWLELGCEVSTMSAREHDEILGLTSHLPHLLAAGLAGILPTECYPFTGTGFRDTTRIAAGDPELWTGIFLQNRQALCRAMVELTERFSEFLEALVHQDADRLTQLLTQAKQVRDALGT